MSRDEYDSATRAPETPTSNRQTDTTFEDSPDLLADVIQPAFAKRPMKPLSSKTAAVNSNSDLDELSSQEVLGVSAAAARKQRSRELSVEVMATKSSGKATRDTMRKKLAAVNDDVPPTSASLAFSNVFHAKMDKESAMKAAEKPAELPASFKQRRPVKKTFGTTARSKSSGESSCWRTFEHQLLTCIG